MAERINDFRLSLVIGMQIRTMYDGWGHLAHELVPPKDFRGLVLEELAAILGQPAEELQGHPLLTDALLPTVADAAFGFNYGLRLRGHLNPEQKKRRSIH